MPDNITFDTIPQSREGGVFLEIDPSMAVGTLPQQTHKLLLIGQKLPGGTAAVNTPIQVSSDSLADGLFGASSMLALMIKKSVFVQNVIGPVDLWAIAVDDPAAGVAATGAMQITGAITESATLNLYITGEQVQVATLTGDTAADVAASIVVAVAGTADIPVSAAIDKADPTKVVFTALNKGLCGNDIELATSYWDDDVLPPGISIAVTAMAGGSGAPDLESVLTAITENQFYSIAAPWTDSENLATLEADLQSRWGGMNMRTSHVFNYRSGTHAELTTWGSTRNSPHMSTWGLKGCPTWGPARIAAFATVCEYYGGIDPAMPLRNLVVPGVKAPRRADRFSYKQRNLLLHDGISSTDVDASGNVVLKRVITNYQTSTAGADDESLLRLETKWTVDYYRYCVRQRILLRFPRHKLVNDEDDIAPGQKAVKPKLIKAELIALHGELIKVGIASDMAQFKRDLIVVRSTADVDRVNAILPPNLVNQFVTFAAAVQYRL